MRTLLNIIWVVFGGFWLFLSYLFFGLIACLLIVTIPARHQKMRWAMASAKLSSASGAAPR